MKKRITSWIMVLAMCLTLLPTAALADETETTEPQTETVTVPAETAHEDAAADEQPSEQPEDDAETDEQPSADPQTNADDGIAVHASHRHHLCGNFYTDGNDNGHDPVHELITYDKVLTSVSGKLYINGVQASVAYDKYLLDTGNYHLGGDLELNHPIAIASKAMVNLCLGGEYGHAYNITANYSDANSAVIELNYLSTLNLTTCQQDSNGNVITHGTDSTTGEKYRGYGIYGTGCTLNMYGQNYKYVTISDNTNSGVYLQNNSTFHMYGGTIKNNVTTGNYRYGGGVRLESSDFVMEDGTITGNSATSRGGGVYLNQMSVNTAHTFTMSGGTITGNNTGDTGGGVYLYQSLDGPLTINVSGKPTIDLNVKNGTLSDGNYIGATASNLYLANNSAPYITIGDLADGARIGVTTYITPTADFDPTVTFATNGTSTNKDYFFSDKNYTVALNSDDNTLQLTSTQIHYHPVCGAYCKGGIHANYQVDSVAREWTPVSDFAGLKKMSAGGYYYLTQDITLTQKWNPNTDTTLCLNGHTIQADGNYDTIEVNNRFVLTDCEPDGKTGSITHKSGNGYGVLVTGNFYLYGGNITGNTYSGNSGAGVYSSENFYMYGGKITNNHNTHASGKGGGLYTSDLCYIYGGEISGNSASMGGGIYMASPYETYDTLFGGTITGNSATEAGGGVYSTTTLTLTGKLTIDGNVLNGTQDDDGLYTGETRNNLCMKTGFAASVDGWNIASLSGKIGLSSDTDFSKDDTSVVVVIGAANKAKYFYSDSDPDVKLKAEDDGNFVLYNGDEPAHYHYQCGKTCIGHSTETTGHAWQPVSNEEDLLAAIGTYRTERYYYLTNDITLTTERYEPHYTVYLCLNGHKLIQSKADTETIKVGWSSYNTKFYLTDCEGGGAVTHAENVTGRGVNVTQAPFTMYGGTITGNTSAESENGAGVYVNGNSSNSGSFRMYGGRVTGNTGSGVYVDSNGTMNLVANPYVLGNKLADGTDCNVFLTEDKVLNIGTSNPLNETARIGVTKALPKGADAVTITNQFSRYNKDNYSTIFKTDAKGYSITPVDLDSYWSTLQLQKHAHTWTYAVSADYRTIAATCNVDGCPLEGKSTFITIAEPTDTTYDGNSKPATVYDSTWEAEAATGPHYTGTQQDGTAYDSDDAPTNAGTYTATISVGTYKARATYTIAPMTITPTVTVEDATYDGGNELKPTVTVKNGEDTLPSSEYDVEYSDNTNAGTGHVTVTAKASSNYTWTAVNQDFTIRKAKYNGGAGITITLYQGNTSYNGSADLPAIFTGTDVPAGAKITSVTPNAANSELLDAIFIDESGRYLYFTTKNSLSVTKDEPYTVVIESTNYTDIPAEVIFSCIAKTDANVSIAKDSDSVAYGGEITIEAAKQADTIGHGTWTWTYDTAVFEAVGATDSSSIKLRALKATTAASTVTATYEEREYFGSDSIAVTVSKKTLTKDDLAFVEDADTFTKAYDGTTDTAAKVQIQDSAKVNDSDDLPTVSGSYAYNSADVNTADKVTFTSAASENDNYILPANLSIEHAASITAAKLTAEGVVTATAVYGTPLNQIAITGLTAKLNGTVIAGTWSFTGDAILPVSSSAAYGATFTPATGADNYQPLTVQITPVITPKAIAVTVTAATRIYGDANPTFTATAADGELVDGDTIESLGLDLHSDAAETSDIGQYDVTGDGTANPNYTVTIDGADKLTVEPKPIAVTAENKSSRIGQPIVELTYIYDSSLLVGNDAFSGALETDANTAVAGDYHITKGTLTLGKNYTINFTAGTYTVTDKLLQDKFAFAQNAVSKTYGDDDFTIPASGEVEDSTVTYSSSDDTVAAVDSTTGEVHILKAGSATISATASSTTDYDTAKVSYVLTVDQATITITAANQTAYVGAQAPILDEKSYKIEGLVKNEQLSTPPVIEYAETPDMSKTGTVSIIVRDAAAPEGDNYKDIVYNFGTLTISNRPSSGGGGGSSTITYPVNAPSKTENGSVTVSAKNAAQGSTVTITVKPDSGYQLDDLTVTDKNGSSLKLTDKGSGKYTFTMPAGKVEIKVSFAEAVQPEVSPFRDVSTSAYYYDAIKWAQEKGITGGIGDSLFGPDLSCTRAQIVTFLWRAAGSPEPKTAGSFTDVPAGSYYAKAVAWAVENGITTGTGEGRFSPDDTCTRAQSVTFLFRAVGKQVSSTTAFRDVSASSYYANAVAWAVENGVTNGIGNGLFGPNESCTRAQIVAFLYRAYQG